MMMMMMMMKKKKRRRRTQPHFILTTKHAFISTYKIIKWQNKPQVLNRTKSENQNYADTLQ
jgi:hypothetical protein